MSDKELLHNTLISPLSSTVCTAVEDDEAEIVLGKIFDKLGEELGAIGYVPSSEVISLVEELTGLYDLEDEDEDWETDEDEDEDEL